MPTLGELLQKTVDSGAKQRFDDITLGLSLCEQVHAAAVALDARAWPEGHQLSDTLGWERVAALRLKHSPGGRDGTGKTARETLRSLRRNAVELVRALRRNREYALEILRREVSANLDDLEAELQNQDQLRWILETGEERGLLMDRAMAVTVGWQWMRRLGVRDEALRRRLLAFHAAVRRLDATWGRTR